MQHFTRRENQTPTGISCYYSFSGIFCRHLRFVVIWHCSYSQLERYGIRSRYCWHHDPELPNGRFGFGWHYLGRFLAIKRTPFRALRIYYCLFFGQYCLWFLPQMDFADKGMIYAWLRFIAGVGLAGELGAGIT